MTKKQSRIFNIFCNKLLYKRTGKASFLDLIVEKPIDIETAAIQLSKCDTRFFERSLCLIVSNFGKAVNRNKSIHLTSL